MIKENDGEPPSNAAPNTLLCNGRGVGFRNLPLHNIFDSKKNWGGLAMQLPDIHNEHRVRRGAGRAKSGLSFGFMGWRISRNNCGNGIKI